MIMGVFKGGGFLVQHPKLICSRYKSLKVYENVPKIYVNLLEIQALMKLFLAALPTITCKERIDLPQFRITVLKEALVKAPKVRLNSVSVGYC